MMFHELPALFPEQKLWGALHHGYSYVISKDVAGYTASAKLFSGPKIELGGYAVHQTFEAAIAACNRFAEDRVS